MLSAILPDGAGNSQTLHLTLGIDNNSRTIFEIQADTILKKKPMKALSSFSSNVNPPLDNRMKKFSFSGQQRLKSIIFFFNEKIIIREELEHVLELK